MQTVLVSLGMFLSIYVEALRRREIVFKLQCVIKLVLGEATRSSFQPHQCAHTIAVLKVFFCLFFVNLRGEIYSLILPSNLFLLQIECFLHVCERSLYLLPFFKK